MYRSESTVIVGTVRLACAGEYDAIAAFGVEGTGAYGAGLARQWAAGQLVIKVD